MGSSIWEKILIVIGIIVFLIIYLIYISFGVKGLQYSFDLSDGWAVFIAIVLSYSKLNFALFVFVFIGLYNYFV